MGISEDILKKIVQRVLKVSKPDRIILFGSAANGHMTPDSDIDLLVIKKKVSNPRGDSVKIRRQIGKLGYPFDVIVMSKDRFNQTKDLIGGLAYPADKHGKVIYACSGKS